MNEISKITFFFDGNEIRLKKIFVTCDDMKYLLYNTNKFIIKDKDSEIVILIYPRGSNLKYLKAFRFLFFEQCKKMDNPDFFVVLDIFMFDKFKSIKVKEKEVYIFTQTEIENLIEFLERNKNENAN